MLPNYKLLSRRRDRFCSLSLPLSACTLQLNCWQNEYFRMLWMLISDSSCNCRANRQLIWFKRGQNATVHSPQISRVSGSRINFASLKLKSQFAISIDIMKRAGTTYVHMYICMCIAKSADSCNIIVLCGGGGRQVKNALQTCRVMFVKGRHLSTATTIARANHQRVAPVAG